VYGRPIPDYTSSDSEMVRVILPGGEPSLEFATLVYEQTKAGVALAPEEMLLLDALFRRRAISTDEAGVLVQRGARFARQVLSKLVERGMVEQRGRTKSREYTLSAAMYQKLGKSREYIRTKGFDTKQREQMVLSHLRAYKTLTCMEVMELCQLTRSQARHLIRKLRDQHSEIMLRGKGRGAYYEWLPS
jgi:ATP-dependent DNA helicase RecG